MRAKILYLLGSYPLWSETFVRQDLELLLQLGVPLRPLALFPGDVQRQPDWPEVPCIQHPGRMTGSPGGRVAAAGAQMRRWVPRSLYTHLSVLRHRELLHTLREIVQQENLCHIHAEFADLPALLAASLARSLGLGYSLGVHARDVHLGKFHAGYLYRRASFITVCNAMALNALLQDCPGALDRTHLIHHGLQLEQWPFRFERRSCATPLRLIFVGRFVPKKGLHTLFAALGKLRHRGQRATLTLVGSGPLRNDLETQAETLGIHQDLAWRGVMSRQQVREEISISDALVIPSVVDANGDQDGIPNVMLEAMALGTPVVGTQVGSLPEVLNEHTGWLAPAGNAAALAQVIGRLPNDPDEVERRRQEARALIEEQFNAAKLALARVSLFDGLTRLRT